jgi:hypothetical protein
MDTRSAAFAATAPPQPPTPPTTPTYEHPPAALAVLHAVLSEFKPHAAAVFPWPSSYVPSHVAARATFGPFEMWLYRSTTWLVHGVMRSPSPALSKLRTSAPVSDRAPFLKVQSDVPALPSASTAKQSFSKLAQFGAILARSSTPVHASRNPPAPSLSQPAVLASVQTTETACSHLG